MICLHCKNKDKCTKFSLVCTTTASAYPSALVTKSLANYNYAPNEIKVLRTKEKCKFNRNGGIAMCDLKKKVCRPPKCINYKEKEVDAVKRYNG